MTINQSPTFKVGDGKVNASLYTSSYASNTYDQANSLVIQSDGKIVLAGSIYFGDFGYEVMRFMPDGSLDTSFNNIGKAIISVGTSFENAFDIATQSDGKIVVVGYAADFGNNNFALLRYNVNGSLDSNFGNQGKVLIDFNGADEVASSVEILADGRILVAGRSGDQIELARYTSTGAVDTSFGVSGKITTSVGNSATASSFTLQADGKILVAGSASNGSNDDFALVRYSSEGVLDASFNGTGIVTTDFQSNQDGVDGVTIQSDGKIVVAGYTGNALGNYDFVVARYNINGSVDSSYGNNGKVFTDFQNGGYDSVGNLVI